MPRSGRRPGWSVSKAAEHIGVSKNTVRRWMDAEEPLLRGWRTHPDRPNSERRVDPDDAERKRLELEGKRRDLKETEPATVT